MTSLVEVLDRFRLQPSPPAGSSNNPFRLVSRLDAPADAREISEAWTGRQTQPALDALELWTVCRTARLFEDVDHGQWGLVLLSPSASAARTAQEREARPEEIRLDDVVLGEFLGDLELLLLAPSEIGRRRVLITLPLDGRADWAGAASGLREFLDRYFDNWGDKYWEAGRRG